jgi:hypothetical protein
LFLVSGSSTEAVVHRNQKPGTRNQKPIPHLPKIWMIMGTALPCSTSIMS